MNIISPKNMDACLNGIARLIERTGEGNNPHLDETPGRFLKAWDFWTQGYGQNPEDIIKNFDLTSHTNDPGLVFQANIPVWSLCAHHLAPFWGVAHVGYLPVKKIVGLSKLARVVDIFARRLQTQEQLSAQIADSLFQHLDCHGVGVVLQCRHSCMESRGVQKSGTMTITSVLRGAIKDDALARSEFMNLVGIAANGLRAV